MTKGLDPNVKMKDSSIEWLGEIPEHWEVKKLKYVVTIKSGDGLSNENIHPEGEFPIYGGNGLLGYTNDFNVNGSTLVVGRVGLLAVELRRFLLSPVERHLRHQRSL